MEKYKCCECSEMWSPEDIDRARWRGAPLRLNKDTGEFLCPECAEYQHFCRIMRTKPEKCKEASTMVCEYCKREMRTARGCIRVPFKSKGQVYEQVKVGDPGDWYEDAGEDAVCGDCGAHYGEYHHPGCDIERCPICGGLAISCDCRLD